MLQGIESRTLAGDSVRPLSLGGRLTIRRKIGWVSVDAKHGAILRLELRLLNDKGAPDPKPSATVLVVVMGAGPKGEPVAVQLDAIGFAAEGQLQYLATRVTGTERLVLRLRQPAGARSVNVYVANLAAEHRLNVAASPVNLPDSIAGAEDPPPRPAWLNAAPPDLAPSLADMMSLAQGARIEALRNQNRISAAAPARDELKRTAVLEWRERGLASALAMVILRVRGQAGRSRALEDLADEIQGTDHAEAIRAYWLAFGFSASGKNAARISAKMFKAGDISSASALVGRYPELAKSQVLGEVRLASVLRSELPRVPPRHQAPAEPVPIKVAYVASRALPILAGGYTIRTHRILKALTSIGVPAVCCVRPGFPHDHHRKLDLSGWADASNQAFDGVDYVFSGVDPIWTDPATYVDRVSQVLENGFRVTRPSVVQAASNQRNALPALIAARRLGLPFIYEVRGLWELTRASRREDWESTERFKLDRALETLVADEADHILTITRGVADELVASGIDANKISLLPNAVDPDLFAPMAKPEELLRRYDLSPSTFTLAYCGSLLHYEGLDDLIAAVGILIGRDVPTRLLIVGEGIDKPQLVETATRLGLSDDVTFVGSVPPDEVRKYWAVADAVAFPRKPFRVCELVSPLKPFESMAMAKPTVLTDLAALRDIVRDGETGLLCKPADPIDLANMLERLAKDIALRGRLGRAARRWVAEERSWSKNAFRLRALYTGLLSAEAGARSDIPVIDKG